MSEKQTLISIIIPTYNRSSYLLECLNSVLTQTYENWECLIIDDGSTDDTEEAIEDIVNSDPRFRYFKRSIIYKPGGCGARNYGLDLSTGNYINWFDNDDVMLPEFLQDKINVLKPQLKMVISSHNIVDEKLNLIKSVNLEIGSTIFKDYLFWKENFPIVTNNILFRKDFLLTNHFRFNEDVLRGQETELFRRIFLISDQEDYIITNKIGFLYRQHEASKTGEDKNDDQKFIKNKIDLCLQGLNYVRNQSESELSKIFLWQATEFLEQTRGVFKDLYFYILNTLLSKSNNNMKFNILINITKMNYYISLPKVIEGKLYQEMVNSFEYDDHD